MAQSLLTFWTPTFAGRCYIVRVNETTGEVEKIPSCPQCAGSSGGGGGSTGASGASGPVECNNCTQGQSGCVLTFYAEAIGDDGSGNYLGQPVSVYIKNFSTGAFELIGSYEPGAASSYPEKVTIGNFTISNDYLNPPCRCDMDIWIDNGKMPPPVPGSSGATGSTGSTGATGSTGWDCYAVWGGCAGEDGCGAVGNCGDYNPCEGAVDPFSSEEKKCCGCSLAYYGNQSIMDGDPVQFDYTGTDSEFQENPNLCISCADYGWWDNYCNCAQEGVACVRDGVWRVPCPDANCPNNNCGATGSTGGGGGGGGSGSSGGGSSGSTGSSGSSGTPQAYPSTRVSKQSSCDSIETNIGSADDGGIVSHSTLNPSGGGFLSSGAGSVPVPAGG